MSRICFKNSDIVAELQFEYGFVRFFFPLLHHLWFLKAKPFLMSKHICTHVCEHLALKCATFNTSGQGIFVLAVIFDYLDKHASVCIGACSHPPTQTHAHTRIHASLLTKHLPLNTHPSIHPTTCTYTLTLMWILSVVLSWGSRPVRSPWRCGDQGRKSLSRPQAPPLAPCLGSGSWEADAMQAPSVACFCGQSV